MDPGFLCLGGVELANRNRVMAYIRNLGMPLLQAPPADTDGCRCPDWGPAEPCSITMEVNLNVAAPETACGGFYGLSGGGSDTWLALAGIYLVSSPTGVRPPMPPLTDPGWVFGEPAEISTDIFEALHGCWPYGVGGTEGFPEAAFQVYTLANVATGATVSVFQYVDFLNMAPGNYAGAGFSFDGGTTWVTSATHTWTDLACSTTPGYVTGRGILSMSESAACSMLYDLSGLVAPITAEVRIYPDPAPTTGSVPADDEPGWISPGPPDVLPTPVMLPQCVPIGAPPEDLPPDGYYKTTLTDALGRSVTFVVIMDFSAQASGAWGATALSFDGGSTWNTPNPGDITEFDFQFGDLAGDFTTPADDLAPWYDPARPESADVLGFYITELIVAPTYSRQMRARQHGGSLGAARFGPREVQVTGWCYTRTERANEYAKSWLFEALVAGSCNGDCGLPDLLMYRTCCGEDNTGELRTLKRVGLVSPPKDLEANKFPKRAGFKFEYTLSAEVPHVFLTPEAVAGGLIMDPDGEPECNICAPCPAPGPSVCTCGNLAAPQRIVTRDDSDDTWCQPALVRRRYIPVAAAQGWDTAAAIIGVTAGSVAATSGWVGLKNLRILAFQNPLGLTGPELVDGETVIDYADYFRCQEPCMSIEVSCLPAGAELVIDAAARTATLTCGNVTGSGYPYLSSRNGAAFAWPELDCSGLMLVIEADEYNTSPDSTLRVEALAQERA